MSDIVLSAGIRQNLLALQSTADLRSLTQNRLATGKKVNSALDNPSNFFTSQSLTFRATDLNALLDSIGQAQKTLEAANNGLTALTNLVSSAKSIAKQARSAPTPATTYSAVNANSDIAAASNLNGNEVVGALTGNNTSLTASNFDPIAISKTATIATETLATHTGAATTVTNSAIYSFDLSVNGGTAQTISFTADASATLAEISAGLQTAVTTAGFTGITVTDNGTALTIATTNVDQDLTIAAATANTALTNGTYNSTSLLDQIVAAGGVAGTSKLSVSVNGGTAQEITFGTSGAQVSTIAELNTALQALTGGVSASAAAGANGLSFSHSAGETNSIGLTVTDVGLRNSLGLNTARTAGQGGGLGTTASDLSRTYNSAATLADSDPTNLLNGGSLTLSVNGSAQTIGLAGTDRLNDIIAKLQGNATLNNNLTFSRTAGDLVVTAKTADVDFVVTHNSTAAAIGLTSGTNVTTNSTSLLDLLNTKLGGSSGQGATLTVAVNGAATQTITFGTNSGEVSTLAELSTALGNLPGITASLTGTALNLQVASGNSQTSLTIGGSAAQAFGLTVGTVNGTASVGANNTTRATLQGDYNSVLNQIDELVKDSSYNGINLLNGDNLKIIFNENGTSSLTISGVTFNAGGLGLSPIAGNGFQSDATIDSTLAQVDISLTTLRNQASKFGSNVTTVQVRQEFTKHLITTLQTGSDALVLADTNEEGANLLALQTRQQLSTTALSLSAQADQAVLRLFG